jgi:hypothetical protein
MVSSKKPACCLGGRQPVAHGEAKRSRGNGDSQNLMSPPAFWAGDSRRSRDCLHYYCFVCLKKSAAVARRKNGRLIRFGCRRSHGSTSLRHGLQAERPPRKRAGSLGNAEKAATSGCGL